MILQMVLAVVTCLIFFVLDLNTLKPVLTRSLFIAFLVTTLLVYTFSLIVLILEIFTNVDINVFGIHKMTKEP
jgi:hypothetical protein